VLKTVQFQHSFFRTNADGHFRLDETDRRPVYVINLGDQAGIVSFPAIRQELLLEDCGTDQAMLDAVGEALKFVRDIRLGDTLPNEIVNGEASWDPDPHHHKIANRRVLAALVKWSEGQDDVVTQPSNLQRFLADHVDRAVISQALKRLDEEVGDLSPGLAQIQPVLIGFAKELAYIEALRETVGRVRRIGTILDRIRHVGGGQANDAHEVAAVLRVFTHMMRMFDQKLESIDDQLGDIVGAVSAHESFRKHIRQVRNQLRSELIAWDGPLGQWEGVTPQNFDLAEVAPKISDLYRFLAPLYSPVDEWVRLGSYHEIIEPDRGADAEAEP
jgi:hypothetical protein